MYYIQLSDQTFVKSIKFYFSYHKDAVSDDDFPDITLDMDLLPEIYLSTYGKDLLTFPREDMFKHKESAEIKLPQLIHARYIYTCKAI